MDPSEKKVLDDIAKYGGHVIHVLEEEGLAHYTTSVAKLAGPATDNLPVAEFIAKKRLPKTG